VGTERVHSSDIMLHYLTNNFRLYETPIR
jgi:hypothetical protein